MKCPFCGSYAAYLCDNVTDPLNNRYYCDKCNAVFTEGGMMVGVGPKEDKKECPFCGRELEESASSEDEYECSNCGITFVSRGDGLEEVDNQTAKADAGKPKLTLVPRQIIYDICEVREYGNAKYPEGGPDNWKNVNKQRYRDAAFRHFLAYLDDPDGVDEESKIKHLKHLACNIAFLCEFENHNERYIAEHYMTLYDDGCKPYMTMKVGGEDGENS